jgi:peptidoglycan/LPS O-acetylase OafA/YrhL
MNQLANQERVYFKGIDGLRAIGSLTVVFGHIELTKSDFSIPNLLHIPYYKYTSGHLGVVLFFVLSGFLITYLLMEEKQKFKTISIKRFYFRRILRIWPIYYLILFLLLFLFPNIINLSYNAKPNLSNLSETYPTLMIFFLMAPNLMSFGIPGIGGGFHLSSIGTEEQFYLFWPWIIKWFKNIMIPLILIFCFIALAPNFCDYLVNHFFIKGTYVYVFFENLRVFFQLFKVDCMALGGIFAYIYFNKKTKLLKFLFNKYVQIIALFFGFGFWIIGVRVHFFKDEFYAIFFAIIILNTAVNPKKIISFDYKWLNYIGKISYGMYVYHWIIILFVLNFTIQMKENSVLFNMLFYCGSIGLTILVSHFSFFKFESYFLKFKDKFALIKSNKI